ncbi:MAG: hypothetical protein E7509_05220 [Ruminococcus sp.]|nr:hypothetical protein [Ruminococcus sp.]
MVYKAKSSLLGKFVVFVLSFLMAIIGYCVYDYINNKYFAGVYPLGKLVALMLGFVPIMVSDIIKNKKITTAVFPLMCIVAVAMWFYYTLPQMSYEKASDSLAVDYDTVQSAVLTFDDEELIDEKVPGYYNGAYLFEASKGNDDYYVVMNPKNGAIYEYEAENNIQMARFFEK